MEGIGVLVLIILVIIAIGLALCFLFWGFIGALAQFVWASEMGFIGIVLFFCCLDFHVSNYGNLGSYMGLLFTLYRALIYEEPRSDLEDYIADIQEYFRCLNAERQRAFQEAQEVSRDYGRLVEILE